MANKPTLPQAMKMVRSGLADAEAKAGPFPGGGAGGYLDWHERRGALMKALADDLAEHLGARITARWDGARVRICGIASSSTSGISGALRNWLAAAERRERREAVPS